MELTLRVTDRDMQSIGGTERDFREILRENFESLSSWLSEAAEQVMGGDIHEVEPFLFEPPKHEGRVLLEVAVPLEEILEDLAECEDGDILQEAAIGAVRSGEVLWRVEEFFWDIIQGGV